MFEDYLQQENPQRIRRVRRSLFDTTVFKVVVKVLSILSTFIFAVVTLGTFTLVGSLIQYRKITQLQPNRATNQKNHLWVQPLLEQSEDDQDNIEGEYLKTEVARDGQGRMIIERRQPKKIATTKAAAVLFDKKTMAGLVESVFVWAFRDLIDSPKYNAVFNESSTILRKDPGHNFEYLYQNNMDAVYHWMILFLIKNGGIETSCDKSARWLVLNENLKISPSEACHVRSIDGQIKHTFYQNEDEWTPLEGSGVVDGIDPITLKWIERRLASDPAAFLHFEVLLLDALIPENDPRLRRAKHFISQNGQSAQLVKRALALVHDMAIVLKTNFSEILEKKWTDIACRDDRNLQPAPVKQVTYPNFKTKIIWRKNVSGSQKLGQIALKVITLIGYLLGNVLSLGMLSFAVTVFQHEKLNKLNSGNRQNPTREERSNNGIWLKPPYKKQRADEEDIPINDEALHAIVSPMEIAEVEKMEDLISSSFKHSFNSLLTMSDEKVAGLRFNKSSKIFNETVQIAGTHKYKYQENMNSLYNFMVFELVKSGGVVQEAGMSRLKFNDHLSVGYSNPCRVPSKDGASQVTFFQNKDAWTPSQGDNPDAFNGVDPVGVKWMIQRLQNDEIALNHLKLLLLNGLIPNESQALQQAKFFIVDGGERGQLVKAAFDQISTIALVIARNFSSEILELWDELADDDSAEPLEKGEAFVLDPYGVEQEWMPPPFLPDEFLVEEIIKTKTLITPIWTNYEGLKLEEGQLDDREDRSLPQNRIDALAILSRQYYWIHAGIRTHGCLMSALTAHIHQGSDASNHNFDPAAIKNAMANYLIQNPQDFSAEIDQSTSSLDQRGWNVAEYQNWLLEGQSPRNKKMRSNNDMGDLEMELFSRTFNIQLAVFEMGRPYLLINGRMIPARTFGPNTTEKFILFNASGFTFYALMPRCRDVQPIDSEEVKESLKHIHDFWGVNNRTEYGEQIRAIPRPQPRSW